jgi:hypothetical protein
LQGGLTLLFKARISVDIPRGAGVVEVVAGDRLREGIQEEGLAAS